MKNSDRDALLERQVQAAEQQTQATRELSEALPNLIRALTEEHVEQPVQGLSPFRLLRGPRGVRTLLQTFGAAFERDGSTVEMWTTIVPESYLLTATARDGSSYAIIRCTCGAEGVLDDPITECSCGRWFLLAGESVRVHRFPAEVEA